MQLTVKKRQYLKSIAHNLHPVVIIGGKGLTDAVIKEVINSLNAHEVIKIRILGDDREFRKSIIDDLCIRTDSYLVQHIGKLLVLYRQKAKVTLHKS